MNAAIEVGRLPHQRGHIFRGRHVEEWATINVRRLDDIIRCYLVVVDIVEMVGDVGPRMLRRLRVAVLLLRRPRVMVDCVLVLGNFY